MSISKVFMITLLLVSTSVSLSSCSKGGDNEPTENDEAENNKSNESASQYKWQYSCWEKDAKVQYEALVNALSRRNPASYLLSSLRNNLQKAQKNMRDVRRKARTNNIIIPESKYETVWA